MPFKLLANGPIISVVFRLTTNFGAACPRSLPPPQTPLGVCGTDRAILSENLRFVTLCTSSIQMASQNWALLQKRLERRKAYSRCP